MPNRRPPRLHTGSLTPAPHPGARAANDPTTQDSSSSRDMARGGVGDERTSASRVVRPITRDHAITELYAAATEVWASIPSSYDHTDPMVQRHARALNDLGVLLARLEA